MITMVVLGWDLIPMMTWNSKTYDIFQYAKKLLNNGLYWVWRP